MPVHRRLGQPGAPGELDQAQHRGALVEGADDRRRPVRAGSQAVCSAQWNAFVDRTTADGPVSAHRPTGAREPHTCRSSCRSQAWCATTPKRRTATDLHGSGLKSVGSALDVLECFALDGELGVSDIARRLGVAKSTAHRLLQTLASRGFVEQDVHSRAVPPRHPRLRARRAGPGPQRAAPRGAARPCARSPPPPGLTVNFSVPDGPDVVFVERIENTRRRAHPRPLRPAPARRTPRAAARRSRRGTPRPTWPAAAPASRRGSASTVRTEADWLRCLESVRKVGYAVSHSESFDGASSVAVPGHLPPGGHRLGVGLRADRGHRAPGRPPRAGARRRQPADRPRAQRLIPTDPGHHLGPTTRPTPGATFPGAEHGTRTLASRSVPS